MNTLSLPRQFLSASQIEDIQLAASKMHGAERRAFQAEMSLKYCEGNVRLTETIFGWGRETVTVGLAEKRTGLICYGAQSALEAVLKKNSFNYRHLATVSLSMAIRIIFSAVVIRISKSFASRRKWPSHAKVLSTIHRFGITLN